MDLLTRDTLTDLSFVGPLENCSPFIAPFNSTEPIGPTKAALTDMYQFHHMT